MTWNPPNSNTLPFRRFNGSSNAISDTPNHSTCSSSNVLVQSRHVDISQLGPYYFRQFNDQIDQPHFVESHKKDGSNPKNINVCIFNDSAAKSLKVQAHINVCDFIILQDLLPGNAYQQRYPNNTPFDNFNCQTGNENQITDIWDEFPQIRINKSQKLFDNTNDPSDRTMVNDENANPGGCDFLHKHVKYGDISSGDGNKNCQNTGLRKTHTPIPEVPDIDFAIEDENSNHSGDRVSSNDNIKLFTEINNLRRDDINLSTTFTPESYGFFAQAMPHSSDPLYQKLTEFFRGSKAFLDDSPPK
ncbi:hypothetical protein RF11_10125 [Thelohanellus kitauei]|uniref:Uncharacterized protein n=1 Tax=Thelohanellus kitauei TaxID=669202 RepID=A0A0C2MNS8_THEKT|nr:hypothetical protein RF11_10125 [Thelohanellus kitauei]